MARTGTLYTGSEAWFAPTRPLAARAAGGVLVGALALGCKKAPPPPPAPRAIPTPPERAIYVTNNGSDSLSVIDRDGVTVTNVPLDIDPVGPRWSADQADRLRAELLPWAGRPGAGDGEAPC